jgi:hypothetical protein
VDLVSVDVPAPFGSKEGMRSLGFALIVLA